ncbi:MAG: competence type IV pilus minor pilin ComGD [Sporolactobacillus sp.]
MRLILRSENGFTLIEMLIVVSIACIIAPLSFMTMAHTSDEAKMKQFTEEMAATIRESQMQAIGESTAVKLLFDTNHHFIAVLTKKGTEKTAIDSRIKLYSNTSNQYIMIARDGSFANPATYSFQCGSIGYHLVLQLGQGRFYFEKAAS